MCELPVNYNYYNKFCWTQFKLREGEKISQITKEKRESFLLLKMVTKQNKPKNA